MDADQPRPPVRRARRVERADLPAGPARDLRDAVYGLYLEADCPTLDELTGKIAEDDLPGMPGRDLINKILSGRDGPASQQDTISVAVALAHLAGRTDASALATSVRQHWIAAHMAPPPPPAPRLGRPIGECDAFDLDVHRAITLPTADDAMPVLPAYVPRDHDARLAEVVRAAAGGTSRFAVLVGGSSTGKTRACWEAIQGLPKPWLVWHPIDPSRPEAAARTLREVGPHTVVWLDETQHYLDTSHAELGEQIVAALRTLLADRTRGPVLVLATLWPEYWATLTTVPDSGKAGLYEQIRRLLVGADIRVPEVFTAADLLALRGLAAGDARLRHAVDHAAGGRITQHLAGVPLLLAQYRNAAPAARAVIDVAIDARRLGLAPAIPHALLAHAAPGYLTDLEWDQAGEDWLERSLAYTARPCHGVPGPLTRIRPRPGEPATLDGQPRYRLADALEQVGRTERAGVTPPTSLWNALPDTVTDGDGLAQTAHAAQSRGLFREAARCYLAATREGYPRAAWSLAALLERGGRIAEAMRWYRWCAETGLDEDGYTQVAWLADRHDVDTEETIGWLREIVESDSATEAPLKGLAYLLEDRRDELNAVLRHRYDIDDENDLRRLGDQFAYAIDDPFDDLDDDELHIGSRAFGPNPFILWTGDSLVRAGNIEVAIRHYQQYADESTYAMRQATRLLEQAGRSEEAIDWLQRELRSGNGKGLWIMAELLIRIGRRPEAERLRAYGVQPDGRIAQPWMVAEPPP